MRIHPSFMGNTGGQGAPPSRIERLQQLQAGDLAQQQQDQSSQAGLMEALKALYGISHDAQLLPAQVGHLNAETHASEAMLPEQLRHAQLGNDAAQFDNQWAQPNAMAKNDLSNAQTGHLNAETDYLSGKGAPATHDVLLAEQMGYVPHGTTQAMMVAHLPPEALAGIKAGQNAETQKHFAGYQDIAQHGGMPDAMQPQVTNEFGPDNWEYLKNLGLQSAPTPPQTNSQAYLKSIGDAVKEKAWKASNVAGIPALSNFYTWLKQTNNPNQ